MTDFALLRTFRGVFEGKKYNHRNSTLGDFVASHLYEDLVALNRSPMLTERPRRDSRIGRRGGGGEVALSR